jgi:hypothetical protein
MEVPLQKLPSDTEAMTHKKVQGESSSVTSESILKDNDLVRADDELGIETGGWLLLHQQLANHLPLNVVKQKPQLTSFFSRQIPQDVHLDNGYVEGSKKKRRASDNVSIATKNLLLIELQMLLLDLHRLEWL